MNTSALERLPKCNPRAQREEICSPIEHSAPRACQITLRGRVQGFGLRPAIVRLAQELQVYGSVRNCGEGVQIHVQGKRDSVQVFLDRLPASLPAGADVDELRAVEVGLAASDEFRIEATVLGGSLCANVPADVATCTSCFAEVADSSNRRSGYLFTTCTQCGPRYSLIGVMPYDREATSMAKFEQCTTCRGEYLLSADRRFHSQTNSCPACGPRLWLTGATGESIRDEQIALRRAITALQQGMIVAVKGIGGYQLIVDATCSEAISRLRRRKQRFGKPLAVMVPDLATAESLASLNPAERAALASPANPIVVVKLRMPSTLSNCVAEGLTTVGLMLPTSPLHELLVRRAGRPLVVTSGNLEGDPLTFEAGTATAELRQVADFFLHHDRPIFSPIDDSVIQIIAGRQATIRLARGLAPLPLQLESDRAILALGGHQKAALALNNGAQAVLGPHVGDLETESTRVRYVAHLDAMSRLYGAKPSLFVHDLHPDYFTSRWAVDQLTATLPVQHHHAHVAAGMLEHGWLDRDVLGVAWDGTGYGTDGTIWGGEFLLATATAFRRVAHLRPFPLPGGSAAIKQPWRVAVVLVREAMGAEAASKLRFPQVSQRTVQEMAHLLANPKPFQRTTSAGRLFDGLAALLLGICESQYEGQPAMLLESACNLSASGAYNIPLCEGEPASLDWRPLIRDLLADLASRVPPETIAMKIHRALATVIFEVARRFSPLPVVLSGGCFHNRILTELVVQRFAGCEQPLGLPGVIPVNDGGLAAGQLAIAIACLRRGVQPCA